MKFPESFKEKYEQLLGEQEAALFFESFNEEAKRGFRINPLKKTTGPTSHQAEPVPWSSTGFRGTVQGNSAEHQAGYVYGQEPSAMFVAEVAHVQPGQKVLDLCAAPGGKSTQLAGMLQGDGLLVSNEIHPQRARILSENMERFGVKNALVTNESPQKLATQFPAYFDVVLVDAPCSGEGMFRKDPDAMSYWTPEYPVVCSLRQKEILDEAMKMLAPGGTLVYSTCTFAPEENEQVIRKLLHEYPELQVDPIQLAEGMVPGRPDWADGHPELAHTARLFPHHLQGEGHFVARVSDTKEGEATLLPTVKPDSLSKEQRTEWDVFWKEALVSEPEGVKQLRKDRLVLIPEGFPAIKKIKVIREGIHAGVFKKNRFEPNHALALALPNEQFRHRLELDEDACRRYFKGETFRTGEDRGWLAVQCGGMTVGWGKEVKGTVKNFYPKGLRF